MSNDSVQAGLQTSDWGDWASRKAVQMVVAKGASNGVVVCDTIFPLKV